MYVVKVFCGFLILAFVKIKQNESARVLGFFPSTGRSHIIIEMALIQTLVDRDHNVTVVTTLPLNDKNPKYRHVKLTEQVAPDDMMIDAIESRTLWALVKSYSRAVDFAAESSKAVLSDPVLKDFLQKEKESFDLVVLGYFSNIFHIGIAAHFKCPVILVDTHKPLRDTNGWIGNPMEMFTVPSSFLPYEQPLAFFERVLNVFCYLLESLFIPLVKIWANKVYAEHFPPPQYPSLDEMTKNISLIFHTSHFSEGPIRPVVPAYVQIGGIQIKQKANPLPKDIENHLQSAREHGAILFSMGTHAKSEHLQPETMKKIFNVFASLKQKVIFKWENSNYPGNSSNILFKKFLPQNDILRHPNLRVFISHCGLGSFTEVQYHGVPLICMPLFGDQFGLSMFVERKAYGVKVSYQELTEETFRKAILEVLNNSTYRDTIKNFSKLYRDRPMHIQDTAAFWMEYVIRHRGAKHMQSPAVHMSFIENYGIDVIGFLIFALYVIFKIFKLLLKAPKFLLCKPKKTAKHKDE